MKKLILLGGIILFSLSAFSQEVGQGSGLTIESEKQELFPTNESVLLYIEPLEINSSLSFLKPEFPERRFELRDADIFRKFEMRQVNMMAVMEKERQHQRSQIVELDSPMPNLSRGEKSIIQVSNQFQMHNRGSNYDIYTGEKKIPAYTEMRAGLFNGYYSPYLGGRRYYSPYSY